MPMTGDELRRLREAAGLTQAELAERLGTTVTSVSRWETGQRRIAEPIARFVRLVLAQGGHETSPGRSRRDAAAVSQHAPARGADAVESGRDRGEGPPRRVQARRSLLPARRAGRGAGVEVERDRDAHRGKRGRKGRGSGTERRKPKRSD